MIELNNLKMCWVGYSKDLDNLEQSLLARKIEKQLLSDYSILCDINIKL